VCVALVASLTEEMAAWNFAYHAHGTADDDKFCCYPWHVPWHKSAVHCSLRLAPTMIIHLTSNFQYRFSTAIGVSLDCVLVLYNQTHVLSLLGVYTSLIQMYQETVS